MTEERIEVEFDSHNVFRTHGFLVSLIIDEEVDKKHAACVCILHTGTDTRDSKYFKGLFGDAVNELVLEYPIDRGIQNDEKAVTEALTAEAGDLDMGKLAKTMKGVFKSIRKRKILRLRLVFSDDIEFGDDYFNKGAPEGRMLKHVLPIVHSKTINDGTAEVEHKHMEAVLIWRAFVSGTDVPIDDVSDIESDDDMAQIVKRAAGLRI